MNVAGNLLTSWETVSFSTALFSSSFWFLPSAISTAAGQWYTLCDHRVKDPTVLVLTLPVVNGTRYVTTGSRTPQCWYLHFRWSMVHVMWPQGQGPHNAGTYTSGGQWYTLCDHRVKDPTVLVLTLPVVNGTRYVTTGSRTPQCWYLHFRFLNFFSHYGDSRPAEQNGIM